MAHLPVLNPESTQSDIHLHLAIIYNCTAQRKQWDGLILNNKDLKAVNYFLSYPILNHHIRAGLFTTLTDTWVGRKKDPERPCHAWAAVVVGKPDGKRGRKVLIWDPSGEHRMTRGGGLYNKVLVGSQLNLITQLGGKSRLEGVWYSKEGRNAEDNCLKVSLEWLEALMREGVPEDLEAAGFVKL